MKAKVKYFLNEKKMKKKKKKKKKKIKKLTKFLMLNA